MRPSRVLSRTDPPLGRGDPGESSPPRSREPSARDRAPKGDQDGSEGDLRDTLDRVAQLHSSWGLRAGPDDSRWVSATELPTRLDELLWSVARHYHTPDRTVAGAFWIGGYTARIAGPALCALLTERRTPDVSMDNVFLRFDHRGYVAEAALDKPRWAGLPGSGATHIAANLPTLRAWLHRRLVADHLAWLAEPLQRIARRSDAMFWASVYDACAAVFVRAAAVGLDPDRCAAEASAFTHLGSMPRSRPGVVHDRSSSVQPLQLRRVGCCLAFRVPAMGPCSSCPHRHRCAGRTVTAEVVAHQAE